ncbi:MAG TPA: HXXEE domain-containing protein [Solirubrobacteraceae bacterium]|nr:HXXEE domain-containing protein [Solirubrobacteraceae bacterium]
MALSGSLVVTHKKLSKPQLFAALNFLALLVHQYEEYEYPGYFPGQFNAGVLHSDEPDHYPLNPDIAMIINTVIGYPAYILPVAFPKKRWIGLAPVLFGFTQAVAHGLIINRLGKARYSPGFLASFFLHVPIGIAYIQALRAEGPIDHADWLKARVCAFALGAGGLAAPNLLLRDKNSPYAFTAKQLGRYAR